MKRRNLLVFCQHMCLPGKIIMISIIIITINTFIVWRTKRNANNLIGALTIKRIQI